MTSELITIGEQLQGARLARGVSIEDVAHETRIPASHIKSLEEGNYSGLPGMAYARSFLRLYGNYLEVDVTDGVATLEDHRELSGDTALYPFLDAPEKVRLSSELMPPRSKTLPLAAIAAAFVLVLSIPFGLLVAKHYFSPGAGDLPEGKVEGGAQSNTETDQSSGSEGLADEETGKSVTNPIPPVIEHVTPERLDKIRNPREPEVRRAEVVAEEQDSEDSDNSEVAPIQSDGTRDPGGA